MTTIRQLLDQRYGPAHDIAARDALTPSIEAILGHRSVRAYLPDALEPGTVELLLAAAQSAPSSSNLQVWSAVVVQDPARKARLAELAGGQQHIHDAPLLLVFLADTSRLSAAGAKQQLPGEGLRYLDTFLMGAIDAALAAQSALIAAESLGLGTVYIGALRNKPEEVARELNLPPRVFPLFGLVVGKPDPARPAAAKPRLAQRAVAFAEQYDGTRIDQEIARYDGVIGEFYVSQQLDNPAWSRHSAERVKSAQSLRGRDRLREAIKGSGFELL